VSHARPITQALYAYYGVVMMGGSHCRMAFGLHTSNVT